MSDLFCSLCMCLTRDTFVAHSPMKPVTHTAAQSVCCVLFVHELM